MRDGIAIRKGELLEEYYIVLSRAWTSMWRAFKRSEMTQDQLAAKLDVDKGLISKRLKGQENLTLKTLSFMATAMDCRLELNYVRFTDVGRCACCGKPLVTGERSKERLEPVTTRAIFVSYLMTEERDGDRLLEPWMKSNALVHFGSEKVAG